MKAINLLQIIILLLLAILSNAQINKKDSLLVIYDFDANSYSGDSIIYTITDSAPIFASGKIQLGKYLKNNVFYPKSMLKERAIETVLLKLIIEKNGHALIYKILTENSKEFIDESKRVISCMPDWIPAKQNDKNVRCYFTIPIKFCPEGCAGWK